MGGTKGTVNTIKVQTVSVLAGVWPAGESWAKRTHAWCSGVGAQVLGDLTRQNPYFHSVFWVEAKPGWRDPEKFEFLVPGLAPACSLGELGGAVVCGLIAVSLCEGFRQRGKLFMGTM